MELVIFSCSPRSESKSNTSSIAHAFKKGFEETQGNKAEIYHLTKRNQWENYKELFKNSKEIIFALPLFVECIPGLMMEFMETLEHKEKLDTNIAFILQGGFPEANQLRTCEKYLEKLPSYLNCNYKGTLLKGNMFSLNLIEKSKEKNLEPFVEMGRVYGKKHCFEKEEVSEFAAPEFFDKKSLTLMKLSSPVSKLAWRYMAKMYDVEGDLKEKPFDKFVKK